MLTASGVPYMGRQNTLIAFAALAAIALLLATGDNACMQFLSRAAGFTSGGSVQFPGAKDYMTNLQAGLGPLAIPASSVGLTVAGFAFIGGQQWAQKILFAVVGGATIVFLGPQIVA